jgi:hypothetical protein
VPRRDGLPPSIVDIEPEYRSGLRWKKGEEEEEEEFEDSDCPPH